MPLNVMISYCKGHYCLSKFLSHLKNVSTSVVKFKATVDGPSSKSVLPEGVTTTVQRETLSFIPCPKAKLVVQKKRSIYTDFSSCIGVIPLMA